MLALAVWVGTATRAPAIDRAVARAVHANRPDDLDPLWRGMALAGGSAALGVVVVASCVFAWRRGGPRWLAFLLGSYLVTEVAFWSVKAVVDRPRPPASLRIATAGSASYPSGHTAIATAVAASLIVAAWRSRRMALRHGGGAVLLLVPLAVGASRLGLGVHWLTDVVGGALLGLGVVLGLAAALLPAPARAEGAARRAAPPRRLRRGRRRSPPGTPSRATR